MLVITSLNSHLYQSELNSMFRMRHRILVGERGWTAIERPDGLERDQFDHEDAIYLVTLDEEREATGCMRLIPTLARNLTAEVFPHLCNLESIPESEFVYDASRLVVDTSERKKEKYSLAASKLICGWIEVGVALGLEDFTGILDVPYFTLSLSMGWEIRAMGTPQEVGGEDVIACRIKADQKQLEIARKLRRVDDPVLSADDIELLHVTHRILHQAPDRRAA